MATKKTTTRSRFVICVDNTDCDDLQVFKVYRAMADNSAARSGYLRVIDDSGEDYLYPAELFVPITLPQAVQRLWRKPEIAATG